MHAAIEVPVRAVRVAAIAVLSALLTPVSYCQPSGSPDFNLLQSASVFRWGIVGFAPHISEEQQALQRLTRLPDAQAQLTLLLKTAPSDEAKIYALCGIREISKQVYDLEAQKVQWHSGTYNEMRADVVARVSIQQKLANIRANGCGVGLR